MIVFDFINPIDMKRTEVVIMFSKNECRISVTNVCALHSFTLHGAFQFITAIKAALNSMTKEEVYDCCNGTVLGKCELFHRVWQPIIQEMEKRSDITSVVHDASFKVDSNDLCTYTAMLNQRKLMNSGMHKKSEITEFNMNCVLIREVLRSDNFKPEIAYRHLVNNIREVSFKADELNHKLKYGQTNMFCYLEERIIDVQEKYNDLKRELDTLSMMLNVVMKFISSLKGIVFIDEKETMQRERDDLALDIKQCKEILINY